MVRAYRRVAEGFKRRGMTDAAALLDNNHITTSLGRALFEEVPPQHRSEAAGTLAGGGRCGVRAAIDAWLSGVAIILNEHVLFACGLAERTTRDRPLVEDYMGSFFDERYVPVQTAVRGVLRKRY
jgi:hypothetical protein